MVDAPTTVAVVVPTITGRSSLLVRALDSVDAQSRRPDEIILVDNGRSPLEVQPRPGITVVRTVAMAGAGQARNIGATMASSDVVAFLDDDDYWHPGYVERIMERFAGDDQPDAVIGRLDRLVGAIEQSFKNFDDYRNTPTARLVELLYLHNPGVTGSSTSVKRTTFLASGGFDVRLTNGHDKYLVVGLLRAGYTVVGCPEAVAVIDDTQRDDRISVDARLAAGIGDALRIHGPAMGWRLRTLNRLKAVRIRSRAVVRSVTR